MAEQNQMPKTARRLEIQVETHEVTIIRRRRRQFGVFCTQCQQDVSTFNMSGRFAVGDDDDLSVLNTLPLQDSTSHLQAGVNVCEVLRDKAWWLVQADP